MSALFLKLVNTSISASWFILAVLVLRLGLRKAPKWVSVALWGLVAVRLVCPVTLESALSLIPSAQTIPLDIAMDTTPAIQSGVPVINQVVNPAIVGSNTPAPGASVNPLQITVAVLANVWALGAAAMLVYTAVSYIRLRRRVFAAVRLRDHIYQSEAVTSPFVLGLFAPKIYLPFRMEEGDMAHVIAHEQAHIRRRDHWWKPIGFALLSIHWFNPLMWLAYILLCRDIELACDEKVIQTLGHDARADYSQALLSCAADRRLIAACPLAFGEVGVKERVKSVLSYKKPAFWLVVLAVAACAAAGVCFLTDPAGISLDKILTQKGFAITDQRMVEMTLTIPKAALPDSIYGGHTFEVNEVPVYQTDTSTVYLERVMQGYEGEHMLYFIFNISQEFSEQGSVLIASEIPANGGARLVHVLRSEVLIGDGVEQEGGVQLRSVGPGSQFSFYIPADLCRQTHDKLEIEVSLNELSYKKLPRGVHGAFGRITGYGISADPTSGRESYHIRVEDLELDCTKEQHLDVVTYMGYVREGVIEDGFVYVTYDQFLFSKNRGKLLELEFSAVPSASASGPTDLGDAVIGSAETEVPIVTVEQKRVYTFASEDPMKEKEVILYEDGTCHFRTPIMAYLASSPMERGTYEENGDRLTIRANRRIYAFRVTHDSLIFDRKGSNGSGGLEDGAVLTGGAVPISDEAAVEALLHALAAYPDNSAIRQELLDYGDATLLYLSHRFLAGEETGERGELMGQIFVELLDGEAIKYDPRNAQDYFDNWLFSAKNTAYQNGEDFVKEQMPKTWLILDDMRYFENPEPVHAGLAIMALTQEEIARVNAAFAPILENGQVNPLSCFFTSYYDEITAMDFVAFMEYFPGGEEIGQEEFKDLWHSAGFPYKEVTDVTKMPVPIHKYSVQAVRDFLEQYAGAKSALAINADPQRGLMELYAYGALYNFTSDMGAGTFYCTRGEREGNIVRLYEESHHGTDLLTLRKQGEEWIFVSHQHLEE